jgi:RNA polymerase sigma-70 factor (ECF subfamily)
MTPDRSFQELMVRLRAGSPDAAARVFDRFAGRLIALARRRLDGPLRAKLDAEDVLQSVYRSFFRRCDRGEFHLDGWDGLWSLLVLLTVRKCGRQAEHYRAARRDVRREDTPVPPGLGGDAWEATGREPTPEEAVVLAETVESLLRGLDGRDRAIVTLSLQGYTVAEVSDEIGRTQRTVQRVLERVRKRLERLQTDDA